MKSTNRLMGIRFWGDYENQPFQIYRYLRTEGKTHFFQHIYRSTTIITRQDGELFSEHFRPASLNNKELDNFLGGVSRRVA